MKDVPGRIPFAVTSGVLVLMNFAGNCIVCAVILRNRFMRTPMNYLLFNLAIADIAVGVSALPIQVLGQLYTHPDGTLGSWLCKLVTGSHVVQLGLLVSAFTLSAIAYERYQAVVFPLTVREKVTKKKVFIFIAISWVAAICGRIIFWVVNFYYDYIENQCDAAPQFLRPRAIYTMCFGGFVFGIPCMLMVVLYSRVIWELERKHDQVINRQQMAANRLKKRITFMLVTVTVIFCATWGTGSTIIISSRGYSHGDLLSIVATLLLCVNSGVNCFLYALFSSQFRKGIRNVFGVCCPRNQPQIRNIANEKTGEYKDSHEQAKVIESKL